jgi:transposase InsO family protein
MIAETPLSVENACKAFSISRQAFYKWKKQEHPKNADKDVLAVMQGIALEFPKYGYRRITYALRRDGFVVNHKKVRRIMKENNLLVRRRKSKPITTQSNHGFQKYPNLVKDKIITGINQAWVSDITYILLLREFVYLAVIMDLFSRRCIGWALSRNPDSQLTLDSLNMAIALRGDVTGCIHHSDHGVQYAAHAYVQRLYEAGMKPSMSEKGNSYENAFAESLIKTIKYEEAYMNEYSTMEDARCNIEQFIKRVYNKKRLHSSIGYKPPMEFENEVLNKSSLN